MDITTSRADPSLSRSHSRDNPLVGPNGQCSNGAMLFARMANSLHQHGYLGPPQAIYEEV